MKKHQQRALFILDSLRIDYETIDITEAVHEAEKKMIGEVAKKRPPNNLHSHPQFFNDDDYRGVSGAQRL